MWEGLSLPHDTKFGNCRGEIVDRRTIFIWSLIHGSGWSGLIKAEPGHQQPQYWPNLCEYSNTFVNTGSAVAWQLSQNLNQSWLSIPWSVISLTCPRIQWVNMPGFSLTQTCQPNWTAIKLVPINIHYICHPEISVNSLMPTQNGWHKTFVTSLNPIR